MLESADDQCWIPVTMGNFDNSRGVAGELVVWLPLEVSPGLMLARFDAADGAVLAIGEAIETALAIARRRGN